MEAATRSSTLWMVNIPRVSASVIIRRKAWIIFETDFSEVSEFEATSKCFWHVGNSDTVVSEFEWNVFDPEPDKLDLDTLSLVSQWMNGFHGVNGTAAVLLTGELHALRRSCHHRSSEWHRSAEQHRICAWWFWITVVVEQWFSVMYFMWEFFILISIRCSWILEHYIPATSREI